MDPIGGKIKSIPENPGNCENVPTVNSPTLVPRINPRKDKSLLPPDVDPARRQEPKDPREPTRSDIINCLKEHYPSANCSLLCDNILAKIVELTKNYQLTVSLQPIGEAILHFCGDLPQEKLDAIRKPLILYFAKKCPENLSYYVFQTCRSTLKELPNCDMLYKTYYKPRPNQFRNSNTSNN